jgi:hypothetical protein
MVLLRMLAFSIADAGASATVSRPVAPQAQRPQASGQSAAPQRTVAAAPASNDWLSIVAQLNLTGPASQLAAHCVMTRKEGNKVHLTLDAEGETFAEGGCGRSHASGARIDRNRSEHSCHARYFRCDGAARLHPPLGDLTILTQSKRRSTSRHALVQIMFRFIDSRSTP